MHYSIEWCPLMTAVWSFHSALELHPTDFQQPGGQTSQDAMGVAAASTLSVMRPPPPHPRLQIKGETLMGTSLPQQQCGFDTALPLFYEL